MTPLPVPPYARLGLSVFAGWSASNPQKKHKPAGPDAVAETRQAVRVASLRLAVTMIGMWSLMPCGRVSTFSMVMPDEVAKSK